MAFQTTSFESPITRREEDLFGRWRLAKDIYSIVTEIPADWSCRIGLFGKWGEGKTSVLKLIETKATEEGLISFWVNPSQAESSDSLWRLVIDAFIEALDKEQLLVEEVRGWRARLLAEKSKPFDDLLELNKKAKAIVGFGRAAIKEWLRPDGEQLCKIRGKLHAKRIIVFVDDLDRSDPKLISVLLLGLRDLLDLPGFSFVVAFDEQVVLEGLTQSNKGWGTGTGFLDKIFDFTFALPKLTDGERIALLKQHIGQICPWMDPNVIGRNADLLPGTPRQLKTLLRNLMVLKPAIERYGSSEIQWDHFFMGQLLRAESPALIQFLIKCDNQTLVLLTNSPPASGGKTTDEKLNELLDSFVGLPKEQRPRVRTILEQWSKRFGMGLNKDFSYYAGFGSVHRDITAKEFEALCTAFFEELSLAKLASKLEAHAVSVESPAREVSLEFFKMLLEAREASLGEAADTDLEDDVVALLEKSEQYLSVLRAFIIATDDYFGIRELNRLVVEGITAQTIKWLHFDVAVYAPTRILEANALILAAKSQIVEPLVWVEILNPWRNTSYSLSAHASTAREKLLSDLFSILRDRIEFAALDAFTNGDSPLEFCGRSAHLGIRWFFTELSSTLWSEPCFTALLKVLQSSGKNDIVRMNARELLECLTFQKPNSSGNLEDFKTILLKPGLSAALWVTIISRRTQYRMHQSTLQIRGVLVELGVPPESLPVPDWMSERARELGMLEHPQFAETSNDSPSPAPTP